MPVSRETIEKLRSANGISSTPGSETTVTEDADGNEVVEKGDVPYGYSFIGAINQLERIGETLDEYGLALADLPDSKRREFEEAHEALQWHVSMFANELVESVAGDDDMLELPNGNTVELPRDAMEKNKSGDMPDPPGNGGNK